MKYYSRRQFFSTAVSGLLPMLAVAAALPFLAASNPLAARDCKGSCAGTCRGLCAVGCTSACKVACGASCYGSCKGSAAYRSDSLAAHPDTIKVKIDSIK